MSCTCPNPLSYLPCSTAPVFIQCADGTLEISPPRGLGARITTDAADPECPIHGTEAVERAQYGWRRSHVMAWREIRKAWPKSRRDAAKAIGIDWWEYADPEGNYRRYHPTK